jgi:hypothetical protein
MDEYNFKTGIYETKPAINPETIVPDAKVEAEAKTKRVRSKSRDIKTEVRNTKLDAYQKQESRRAAKIQIDQKVILTSWILGVAIAFLSSAIVSFNAITATAENVGEMPQWMAGLFFFFIELMYLLFLVAYLVLASRVDDNGKREKTWGPIFGMSFFGGIAVYSNAFHTFAFHDWDWSKPGLLVGLILSIAAPIAIISISKMASRVVFAKAISL